MGMKDWFMDRQMKKMSKDEKETMMTRMMDKFFASMNRKDKKEMMISMMPKMMDNMFSGMSSIDKREMMMSMMPKMMSQMFGGEKNGGMPMMKMMEGMMGSGDKGDNGFTPPWISMEKAFEKATDATEYSLLSTGEIHTLFKEWTEQISKKIQNSFEETTDLNEISKRLKLSRASLYFLICKLAQENKLNLKVIPRKK